MKENEYKVIQTGFNIFIIMDCLKSFRCDNEVLNLMDNHQDLTEIRTKQKQICQKDPDLKQKFGQYFQQKASNKKLFMSIGNKVELFGINHLLEGVNDQVNMIKNIAEQLIQDKDEYEQQSEHDELDDVIE
jgi:hypothetical protein